VHLQSTVHKQSNQGSHQSPVQCKPNSRTFQRRFGTFKDHLSDTKRHYYRHFCTGIVLICTSGNFAKINLIKHYCNTKTAITTTLDKQHEQIITAAMNCTIHTGNIQNMSEEACIQ